MSNTTRNVSQSGLMRIREILRLCRTPRTAAQITWELRLPAGSVYRILGDLRSIGWIDSRGPAGGRGHNEQVHVSLVNIVPSEAPEYPKGCPRCHQLLRTYEHEKAHDVSAERCNPPRTVVST